MTANKIYLQVGGGLGDALNHFFTGEPSYAQALKDRDPTTFIQVLCSCSNAGIKDIFEMHPAFDKVTLSSSMPNDTRCAIAQLVADGYRQPTIDSTLHREPQRVYLSQEEDEQVTPLLRKIRPYVAVHPFNSAGTGITATHFQHNTDYLRIIRQIIAAGYHVVQVGGDWTHLPTGGRICEQFNFEHPRFVNLVNKFNLRMTAQVVMRADKFIGTSSAWLIVAALNGVPSFMILPEHMKDILRDEQRDCPGMRGTLLCQYGVQAGAALPELYQLTEAFLAAKLARKIPELTSDGLVLREAGE